MLFGKDETRDRIESGEMTTGNCDPSGAQNRGFVGKQLAFCNRQTLSPFPRIARKRSAP